MRCNRLSSLPARLDAQRAPLRIVVQEAAAARRASGVSRSFASQPGAPRDPSRGLRERARAASDEVTDGVSFAVVLAAGVAGASFNPPSGADQVLLIYPA